MGSGEKTVRIKQLQPKNDISRMIVKELQEKGQIKMCTTNGKDFK